MSFGTDVVVVGGGLAGLASAVMLGRSGRSVVVLEKAHAPGGRAATRETKGYFLNRGAHALYRGGPAWRVLHELGVVPRGGAPATDGGFVVNRGVLHTLPTGPASLLTTGLFGLSEKLEAARLLGALASLDTTGLDAVRLADWMDLRRMSPGVRRFLATMIRLVTFDAAIERMSAGAAIRQLQLGSKEGVLYLDQGWGTLVEGLRRAAINAGVEIRTGARVEAIDIDGGASAVRGVQLASGERLGCGAVIIAASPAVASALAPESRALKEASARLVPIHAACLDVALSALPRPKSKLVLGIDRPLYLSMHSAVARLAPESGALIHTMLYRPSGDPRADEAELEGLLDLTQPGWRDGLVERQFLPSMVVSNAAVTAAGGGLAGRPDVDVAGIEGLFVAGDWVGPEGMLADASLASAKRAAERATRRASAHGDARPFGAAASAA